MDLFGLKRRRYWKPLRELGLEPEELALVEADLQHGDQEAATAHMAAAQERARSLFKAQTGIDSRNILPLVGSEISWGEIVRHMFKIHDFDRAGTTIGPNDQVKASSLNHPYGYLLVDSPILDQKVSLPIIHRDDFILATTVFDEPRLVQLLAEAELLVTYAPKRVLPTGLSGSSSHVLHYAIVPLGTLDRYYSMDGDRHMALPAPEKLFGQFVYEGEIKVPVIPEPAL